MQYTYDAEASKKVIEENFTWINGYMRNVRRYPQRYAMFDPIKNKEWTYETFNKDVNKLANAFVKAGVSQNDVVLYQLYNSPQFAFCYVAPQKLCAVNSPINFNLSAGETANLIDRDKPKVYIYDCDVKEMAWDAVELCKYKPQTIIAVNYHGEDITLPEGHIFFDDFVKDESEDEPDVKPEFNMYSEVTRLCTSGTTGTPKGVPLNNVNEVMSAHDAIMHFPLNPTDITMNMTPWFHRGGIHSGGPTPTFYVGASLVVMRMFSARACFDYVERYGVTFLIGVPSALTNLATRQEKHPCDLSGLRGIVTMGSPLDKQDCIRFQKLLTTKIFNGYGTTETFWNCFLRPYDLPDMSGSCGLSCTDDEVRIVNIYPDRKAEADDIVPADGKSEGEIIINAWAKSAQSYSSNPEETEKKYYKGWFYTNDIGTWDENHYVSVAGRKDDMIICMGENIYPAQLEEILNQHPLVKDSMVTAVPDKSRGQAVAAYIVPVDDTLTVKDMNTYCAENKHISRYKVPRYYRLVDELPYNSTGKKQHVVLKKQAEEDLKNGLLQRP